MNLFHHVTFVICHSLALLAFYVGLLFPKQLGQIETNVAGWSLGSPFSEIYLTSLPYIKDGNYN